MKLIAVVLLVIALGATTAFRDHHAKAAVSDAYPALHLAVPGAIVTSTNGVTWVAVSDSDVASYADCQTVKHDVLLDHPDAQVGVAVVQAYNRSTVCAAP